MATFSFGRMSDVQPAKFRNMFSCCTFGSSAETIERAEHQAEPDHVPGHLLVGGDGLLRVIARVLDVISICRPQIPPALFLASQ